MKKNLIFLLFFIVCEVNYSQNTDTPVGSSSQAKKGDVILIADRALLVELLGEPNADEDIKEVVDKIWKFNEVIRYVKKENIAGILKNKEGLYAVLAVDRVHAECIGHVNEFFRFSVKLGEKYNKTTPAFYQDVPFSYENEKVFLAKRDIYFAINIIQNHFNARKDGKSRISVFYQEMRENRGKLENKILLIDRKLMDEKLDENEIAGNYLFKYKVTDEKEVESAIATNDDKYAYVEIFPMGDGHHLMMHYVIDCKDGQILSIGDVYGSLDFSEPFSNLINKKHLRWYTKNSKGKLKNHTKDN